MTSLLQDPLLWVLLAVLLAAVFAVMKARRTNMALRRQNENLRSARDGLQGERNQLYTDYAALRTQHSDALAEVRQDAEAETKDVLKSAMRTLQVLADEQQHVIDKAQRKYGDDSEILADLMLVDHTNSQFSRRAQGIAVLCGGWLGRRETIASVYDVARSAQGRIKHFDRVRINSQVNVSVAPRAVEPVAVVLAELLANATNYSAPGTPVEINIQTVSTGVCLIVDDAGLGMSQEEKDRAAELLDPQGPVAITGLGNPPKFGFAVSGMLAARYGFKVSVDSVSPYGGVRAVILLPENLLTTNVPEPEESGATGHRHADGQSAVPGPTPVPDPEPMAQPQRLTSMATSAHHATPARPVGTTAGGLPKRRRISSVSVVPFPVDADEAEREQPEPEHGGQVTAARISAFARGTQLGRNTPSTEGPEAQ
ncbi:ATP-binding protein [Streptomyces griseoaurantiacus]|uniref:ATP-binding protein n=1 Tax=Streptomyces griseoaurantiacus TaxID=68213 RepID=UPI00378A189C